MKNFILGQYVPYNSFIHRLDPRNKILCLILLMIGVFYQFKTPDGDTNWAMTFLVAGTLFFFILILMFIAHVPFKRLFSSLKAMWFLIIFLLIINCLVPYNNGTVAFYIGNFAIYWESFLQSFRIILRLIMMLSLAMILTTTTKPLDLTGALEWYMSPLKIIKFPAHEIAMIVSLALRLIPTLLEETEQIMKAQASRGVDFKSGGVKMKIRAITSLIVPLFVSSFKRSDELADAMSARGYNPRAKRTRYRKLKFSINDLFTFILCGLIMSGVITLSYFKVDILADLFLPSYFIALYAVMFITIVIGVIDSLFIKKREA